MFIHFRIEKKKESINHVVKNNNSFHFYAVSDCYYDRLRIKSSIILDREARCLFKEMFMTWKK